MRNTILYRWKERRGNKWPEHCLIWTQIPYTLVPMVYILLSKQWHLSFNPKKCLLYIVRFSSRPQHLITHDYHINNMPISNQNLYPDLGVILTSNLSWNEHYKHLLSNAYRTLSLIRRTFIATHCPFRTRNSIPSTGLFKTDVLLSCLETSIY